MNWSDRVTASLLFSFVSLLGAPKIVHDVAPICCDNFINGMIGFYAQ